MQCCVTIYQSNSLIAIKTATVFSPGPSCPIAHCSPFYWLLRLWCRYCFLVLIRLSWSPPSYRVRWYWRGVLWCWWWWRVLWWWWWVVVEGRAYLAVPSLPCRNNTLRRRLCCAASPAETTRIYAPSPPVTVALIHLQYRNNIAPDGCFGRHWLSNVYIIHFYLD